MQGTAGMRKRITDLIDDDTHPEQMEPQEAIAYLEELTADLNDRIEALKKENDLV